jgi:hypothetical protein
MKYSVLTAITLAASAIAAPAGLPALPLPSGLSNLVPGLGSAATPSVPAGAATPSSTPGSSGQLVTDLGPVVQQVLTVTGQDLKPLLLQLSPEVTALVSALGLPSVGTPVGSIVATASSLGDLLTSLGPNVNNLLVAVGQDASFLLIELAPSVASLVAGLGLPPLSVPVGAIVTTVGNHVKRAGTGQLLADIGKQVDGILTVTGPQAQLLLIQLSPEVTALLSGLGLPAVGVPVGSVVASASSVGALLTALGPGLQGILLVVEQDGKFLLISLAPTLTGLLSGLGLPAVGIPVGTVVATVAANL